MSSFLPLHSRAHTYVAIRFPIVVTLPVMPSGKRRALHRLSSNRVPEQLPTLLRRRGWTQADLARKLNVSETQISYLVRRRRSSLALAQRIADLLGVELHISLGGPKRRATG